MTTSVATGAKPVGEPRRRGRPSRTAPSADETRSAIIAAALELFVDRGFDGASMRDIAERAGVKHGLLSYYFADKSALWREAVRTLNADVDRVMGASWRSTEGRPDVERFSTYVRDYVRYCARHPEHARLIMQESVRDSERVRWVAEGVLATQHRSIEPLLHRLMAGGYLPDVPVLSMICILSAGAQTLFTHAVALRYAHDVDVMTEQAVERHADALLAVVLRNPGQR